MRICIIDDSLTNIEAAKTQLGEHELATFDSYMEACAALRRDQFDIVLTDLMFPAEPNTLGGVGLSYVGHPFDAGMLISMLATQLDVPLVAIVTDCNHHSHPAAAALDWIFHGKQSVDIQLGSTRVHVTHAPLRDGVKDWAAVVARLMS